MIHKSYSKSDPQLLLKNWSTTVTKIVIYKLYLEIGSQTLLKNWSKNVTQKMIESTKISDLTKSVFF